MEMIMRGHADQDTDVNLRQYNAKCDQQQMPIINLLPYCVRIIKLELNGLNKNKNKITIYLREPQKYVRLMELSNRILFIFST